MKKFRFPLRTVAVVRSLQEMRARELFSKSVKAFAEAEERLRVICARVSDLERLLTEHRAGVFRPVDQGSFLQTYKLETQAAAKAAAESVVAKTGMENARQFWLESRRKVRVIENLERKARWNHTREMEHEDQAALDDRASALAARAAQEVS